LACVEKVAACAVGLGWREIGRVDSPIAGPAGNVEILLGLAPAR
jgi:predicted rRNA methylase YqxC with S4 and FtsJ domains